MAAILHIVVVLVVVVDRITSAAGVRDNNNNNLSKWKGNDSRFVVNGNRAVSLNVSVANSNAGQAYIQHVLRLDVFGILQNKTKHK